jgi:hypothetical protein
MLIHPEAIGVEIEGDTPAAKKRLAELAAMSAMIAD